MKIRTRGESDLTTASAKIVENSKKKASMEVLNPDSLRKKGLP